jgi:hypothetical protein
VVPVVARARTGVRGLAVVLAALVVVPLLPALTAAAAPPSRCAVGLDVTPPGSPATGCWWRGGLLVHNPTSALLRVRPVGVTRLGAPGPAVPATLQRRAAAVLAASRSRWPTLAVELAPGQALVATSSWGMPAVEVNQTREHAVLSFAVGRVVGYAERHLPLSQRLPDQLARCAEAAARLLPPATPDAQLDLALAQAVVRSTTACKAVVDSVPGHRAPQQSLSTRLRTVQQGTTALRARRAVGVLLRTLRAR